MRLVTFRAAAGPARVGELRSDSTIIELRCSVTRAETEPMRFSWPELVAHAGRATRLRPGDVLGSGTLTGGCLLEPGPIDGHWIEPGDEVRLYAEGLGELRTPVV